MSDPKRMLSDPELGDLLRADLDASAKRSIDYDVEIGLVRHVVLVAVGPPTPAVQPQPLSYPS